jgi:hypothetical protein
MHAINSFTFPLRKAIIGIISFGSAPSTIRHGINPDKINPILKNKKNFTVIKKITEYLDKKIVG